MEDAEIFSADCLQLLLKHRKLYGKEMLALLRVLKKSIQLLSETMVLILKSYCQKASTDYVWRKRKLPERSFQSGK